MPAATAHDDQVSRRRALRVMSGVGLGVADVTTGLGTAAAAATRTGSAPSTAAGTTAPATSSRILTREIDDGPYYLDLEQVRRDIIEDRAGVPLDLRGVQLTDRRGVAELLSIYPGWNQGRAIHIHVQAHIDGRVVDGRYEGGHVSHTGQIFFPETMSVEIEKLEPYKSNTVVRVTNGRDAVYNRFDGASTEIALQHRGGSSIRHGLCGAVTLGVDPTVVRPTP